jgi:hypothetical protein
VAVVSNRKPKLEAGKKLDIKKDEPAGVEASKQTKPRRAASKKTASKKTSGNKKPTSKKPAGHPKLESNRGVSKKPAAVKRTKKVPAKRAAAGNEPDAAEAAELDPFEVAKQTMKGSVPAIVEAMVERAKKGSCSHAKTLLEMTGAKHMFAGEPEAEDSGEPWAKLVLERMDEAEQESLKKELPEILAEP